MGRAKRQYVKIPPEMLEKADDVAAKQGMTRAELIRQALRDYIANWRAVEMEFIVPKED